MKKYVTQPFRGTPSGYVRRVAAMWLGRWWWAVLVPPMVCVVLSVHEAVWLFVAMMLIFLLYPGLTMLIYFKYALSQEAQRTLYEQIVTVGEDSISIEYPEKNLREEYTVRDITGIEYNRRHVLVKLKRPRYNHIAIPTDGERDEEKQLLYEILANYDTTGN